MEGILQRRTLVVLGILLSAGILLGGIWLSVEADGRIVVGQGQVIADEPLVTEQTAVTVTLPLVNRNYVQPAPVFGVQMYTVTEERGLVQAVKAGMRWVRVMAFPWDEIEPVRTSPPSYNWSSVDEESLLNARANGMEPIAIVHFTPSWAQAYAGVSCGPIRADAMNAFAQFLKAAVARYSAPPYNVRYWELVNEPDVDRRLVSPTSAFGCWGDIDDPYYGGRYYGYMLQVVYPAIKAANPNAQVLFGGLLLDCNPENPPVGKNCTPGKYLEGALVNGGGPYFDGVSFHAYTYYFDDRDAIENPNWPGSVTAIPEKTAFLRGVLARYGFLEKKLMNTEAAVLCFNGTTACWNAQARYMPQAYAEAMAVGLQAQIHYRMIQGGQWWYTGLLWSDLVPKPSYYSYAAASEFLSPTTYQGLASGYPTGIMGYTFKKGYGLAHTDVIWSKDGLVHGVTLPAGATAYDLNGNEIASSGDIQVSKNPVFIIRP